MDNYLALHGDEDVASFIDRAGTFGRAMDGELDRVITPSLLDMIRQGAMHLLNEHANANGKADAGLIMVTVSLGSRCYPIRLKSAVAEGVAA